MTGSEMTETFTPTAVQGSVRSDFRQVLHWRFSKNSSRTIVLQVLAIPLALLTGFAFIVLASLLGRFDENFRIGIPDSVIFLAACAATPVLHELVHGWIMRLFGARPQYGVLLKQLLFYASSPGYAFRRNAYIVVALAPLMVLSSVAVLGMLVLQGANWATLLAVCAALNAGGAVGDLWIVFMILRYSMDVYVVDERDGFRVLVKRI